jgi:TonB family protein
METVAKIIGALALALTQAVAQVPGQDSNPQTSPENVESASSSISIHRFPIHEVNPSYPAKHRKKNAQGKIVLLVTIATDGSVKEVSVLSGDPSLTPAAVEAVRQWRYVPEFRNGSTLESQDTVTLDYDLGKDTSRPGNPALNVPTSPSEDLLREYVTGEICRVGGAVKPPRGIYEPDPEYSEQARQAKFQGSATLGLVLGPDGLARDTWIVRGLGMGLDEKAIEAVRQWRFEPATRNGEPVGVVLIVEVTFHVY